MRSLQLGSQIGWSIVGYAFTLVVGFPLQVLVARSVGAEGLGSFNLLESSMALLAVPLSFGLASAVVKMVPALLHDRHFATIRRLLQRDALILAVAGFICVVAGGFSYPFIARLFDITQIGQAGFVLALLLVPCSLLLFYFQQALRGLMAAREIVFGTSILQLSIKAAVIVVVVYYLERGVTGLVVAAVVSTAAALLYTIWCLRRKTGVPDSGDEPDWGDVQRRHFAYARIQYTSSLLDLTSFNVDRYLLGFFFGAAAVGVFSTARVLAQMPKVFLQMLVAASSPLFAGTHARNDIAEAKSIYYLSVDWGVRLSFPVFIFSAVFADQLLGMFGAEFAAKGKPAFLVFLTASALNSATGPIGTFITLWGLERPALRLHFLYQAILLGGYVLLIPMFGILGAAGADLLAMLFALVAGNIVARRLLHVTWYDARFRRWLLPMAAFLLACVALGYHAPFSLSVVNLVIAFIVLNLAFHLWFLLAGLHDDDKMLLAQIATRLGLRN